MVLDKDTLYIKIVALDEIYTFLFYDFSFEIVKTVKKINIKFHQHINRLSSLLSLKSQDTLYIKIVALDDIYKFIVFLTFIL
jgi:hypothetical protein